MLKIFSSFQLLLWEIMVHVSTGGFIAWMLSLVTLMVILTDKAVVIKSGFY